MVALIIMQLEPTENDKSHHLLHVLAGPMAGLHGNVTSLSFRTRHEILKILKMIDSV